MAWQGICIERAALIVNRVVWNEGGEGRGGMGWEQKTKRELWSGFCTSVEI
jgi:hypothetical protein